MNVRGIRGATTVSANQTSLILEATQELLGEIIRLNQVKPEDIASVFITVSPDLNATFPARIIRDLEGWEMVPLMCSVEIDVPEGLSKCIRLLVHINTCKEQKEIHHVYLRKARSLRPDLVSQTGR